jgi:chaperone required for assembly of F1-ATPase
LNEAAARRFYKSVRVEEADGGFAIRLDERTLKTRQGAHFEAPTRALAEACASEWDAQREHILFSSMPITRLTFEAIDLTAAARADYAAFVAEYGQTDLCCHRAEAPQELVAREAAVRQPIVDWAARELGVALTVVTGVQAAAPNPKAAASLRTRAEALDNFRLVALAQATKLAGSVLIGMALVEGRLDAQQAYEAAALDELWSLEKWGEDAEARTRLDRQRANFEAISRFIAALEGP